MRNPYKPLSRLQQGIFCLLLLLNMLVLPGFAIAQTPVDTSNSVKKVNVACPVITNVNLVANKVIGCEGDLIHFNMSFGITTGFTGPYQFQIIANGNVISNTLDVTNATLKLTDVVWGVMTYVGGGCNTVIVSNQLTGFDFEPRVTPSVTITSSQSNAVCLGSSITYTATPVNGGNNPNYRWQVNGVDVVVSGGPTFKSTTLKNGDQVNCILTVISNPCLLANYVSSNTLTAQFLALASPAPIVTIDASANKVYTGTPITFTASTSNTGTNTNYQWQVNGTNVGTNVPTFTSSALNNGDKVGCVISTDLGCTVLATSNVISAIILPTPPITAPNTFTPNGDGVNDTWKIAGLSIFPNCLIKVFNRYGIIIYQSRGNSTTWDGTGADKRPLPDGVYYYIIDPGNKAPEVSGWVAIIR